MMRNTVMTLYPRAAKLALALALSWWAISAIEAQESPTRAILDGDFLFPVDHAWGLPHLPPLRSVYSADSFPLLGASYRGYIVLDLYFPSDQPAVYSPRDFRVADDGYRYADAGIDPAIEPLLMIAGGDIVIPLRRACYERPEGVLTGDGRGCSYFYGGPERMYPFLASELGAFSDYDGSWREGSPGLWDDGIEAVSAWSSLTETVRGVSVTYDEGRMRHPFYSYCDSDLNFNNGSLFWAEGDDGPGIGGTIELRFSRPSDHLMVLNGAVDVTRRQLYKDNNRLKRIEVRASDGSFRLEYEFEDVVAFHRIDLPSLASGVRLTILEVYPGRRWDDTCVTAIFLKQPPLRPRAEYLEEVRRYVALRGIDRRIVERERRRGAHP